MVVNQREIPAIPEGKGVLGFGFKVEICSNPGSDMPKDQRPMIEVECIGATLAQATAEAFGISTNHLLTHLAESGPTRSCNPIAGDIYTVFYDLKNPNQLTWVPTIQKNIVSSIAGFLGFGR